MSKFITFIFLRLCFLCHARSTNVLYNAVFDSLYIEGLCYKSADSADLALERFLECEKIDSKNAALSFELSKVSSYSLVCLIMVIVASLLTALGVFDDLINKFTCGLIIPTTGFAHSVTSSAMEYRKDGLITGLGSNFFKLAGSVILYGIIAAFFLCLLKVVFYV